MGFNPFAAGGGAGGDYVHNYTTFDDLGIDTHGKTMEEILKEVADMNLPVNTIITGQLYTEAAPDERIYNCEGEIQITQGKYGQVYWCRATSASISPYSWDSIYNQTTDEDNPIDNILPWTPTYYQSTEINEIKKKLEELGADWVGRFERDEDGNILGEYFNDYENNKATGLYSHTEGKNNINLGASTHVEGSDNQFNSLGGSSHIEGRFNKINFIEGHNAKYSHIEGVANSADPGRSLHMEGDSNHVKQDSDCLHIEGNNNKYTGTEFVEGASNLGEYGTHIEGNMNKVKAGSFSSYGHHIEGSQNIVNIDSDTEGIHVEGQGNYVIEASSGTHVSGCNNIENEPPLPFDYADSANYVEGQNNVSKNFTGHTQGYGNTNIGYFSTVGGLGNYSNGAFNTVFGGDAISKKEIIHSVNITITKVSDGTTNLGKINPGILPEQNKSRDLKTKRVDEFSGDWPAKEGIFYVNFCNADGDIIEKKSFYCYDKNFIVENNYWPTNSKISQIKIVKYIDAKNICIDGGATVSGCKNTIITPTVSMFNGTNNTGLGFNTIEGVNNLITGDVVQSHTEGGTNININSSQSHMEGNNNAIQGSNRTHIEGDTNRAYNCHTMHIEGENNFADNAYQGHIEGVSNTIGLKKGEIGNGAVVFGAHVEGCNNRVYALAGHAEGGGNTVLGKDGHAEGEGNTVYGTHNHAGGYQNTIHGDSSIVSGRNNNITSTGDSNFVSGTGNTLKSGSANILSGSGNSISSASNSIVSGFFTTIKKASIQHSLVIGERHEISSTTDNSINIANYLIGGYGNEIHSGGPGTFICGYTNTVKNSSIASAAIGWNNVLDTGGPMGSIVIGDGNIGQGTGTVGIGSRNNPLGSYSCAFGNANKINGSFNSAFGNANSIESISMSDGNVGDNIIIGSSNDIYAGASNLIVNSAGQVGNGYQRVVYSNLSLKISSIEAMSESDWLTKNKKNYYLLTLEQSYSSLKIGKLYKLEVEASDGTISYLFGKCISTNSFGVNEYRETGTIRTIELVGNVIGAGDRDTSYKIAENGIFQGYGNIVSTDKNILIGANDNSICLGSTGNKIIGNHNFTHSGAYNSFILGNNNLLYNSVSENYVFGNSNKNINNGANYNFVFSNNSMNTITMNNGSSNNFIYSGGGDISTSNSSNHNIVLNIGGFTGLNNGSSKNFVVSTTSSGPGTRFTASENNFSFNTNVMSYATGNVVFNTIRSDDNAFNVIGSQYNKVEGCFICGRGLNLIKKKDAYIIGRYAATKKDGTLDEKTSDDLILIAQGGESQTSTSGYNLCSMSRWGDIAIGPMATALNSTSQTLMPSIAIGGGAQASSNKTNGGGVAIGPACIATNQGYAFGNGAVADGLKSFALMSAKAHGTNSICAGDYIESFGYGSCLYGEMSNEISKAYQHMKKDNHVVMEDTNYYFNYLSGRGNTLDGWITHSYINGQGNTLRGIVDFNYIEGQGNKIGSISREKYVYNFQNYIFGQSNSIDNSQFIYIHGLGLKASDENNKAILGCYNAIDTEDKFALVIGNGTADDARSNAFAVSKTGDIYVKNSDTPIDLTPVPMSLLEEICV